MTSEQATFLKAACDLAGGECTIRQYNTHAIIVIDNEADLLPAVVAYLALVLSLAMSLRNVIEVGSFLRSSSLARSIAELMVVPAMCFLISL